MLIFSAVKSNTGYFIEITTPSISTGNNYDKDNQYTTLHRVNLIKKV